MRRLVPTLLVLVCAGVAVPPAASAHQSRANVAFLHDAVAPRYHEAVALRRHLARLYHQVASERWRVHHLGMPHRLRRLSWRLPRLRRAAAWRLRELAALRHEASWRPPRPRIPHLAAWLCIHSGEGAWNAETGNGYHGGLQMDSSFEQTYGAAAYARWGHASAWPPAEQMLAAERAYASRGFAPWPLTARACGLL